MIDSFKHHSCLRPFHGEITGSRLISKVKHRRAWVVLGWVTTWEVRVLYTFCLLPFNFQKTYDIRLIHNLLVGDKTLIKNISLFSNLLTNLKNL